MQTWKVCSHNKTHIRLRVHGWVGHGWGSDLTTTCVMLLVTLLMSSSRPRSPCAFRTSLYLPRGCWFPAVLEKLDTSPSVPPNASREKQKLQSVNSQHTWFWYVETSGRTESKTPADGPCFSLFRYQFFFSSTCGNGNALPAV